MSSMSNSTMTSNSMANSTMTMDSMSNSSYMVYSSLCVGGSADLMRNLLLNRVTHLSGYWMADLPRYSMAHLSGDWHLNGGACLARNSYTHLSWDETGILNWNLVTLPFSDGLANWNRVGHLPIMGVSFSIGFWLSISVTFTKMVANTGKSNTSMSDNSMSKTGKSNNSMSSRYSSITNSMAYCMSNHSSRSMDLCSSLSTVLGNNILTLINKGGINDGVGFSVASLFSHCVALLLWPEVGDSAASLLCNGVASRFSDGLASLADRNFVLSVTVSGMSDRCDGYSCVAVTMMTAVAVTVMTIVSISVSSWLGISVTFD